MRGPKTRTLSSSIALLIVLFDNSNGFSQRRTQSSPTRGLPLSLPPVSIDHSSRYTRCLASAASSNDDQYDQGQQRSSSKIVTSARAASFDTMLTPSTNDTLSFGQGHNAAVSTINSRLAYCTTSLATISSTKLVPSRAGTKLVLTRTWRKVQAAFKIDKGAIAKMGIAFGLTYNLISNMNGSISLSLAWYIASKKTGLSPLEDWKALAAAYSTLYVFLCVLRPFRVALAIGATCKMESFLLHVQERFGCKRPAAIGVAAASSFLLWGCLCALGVTVASAVAEVPIWRTSPL